MIDTITITGGVVAEPELRFTNSGAAVCSFRIAQSDHKKNDQGEWEKTQALYLQVNIWNDNPERRRNPVAWAELAANLTVGQPVAVKGKLITRTWQAKDGTNRSQVEFAATEFYVHPADTIAPPQSSGGFAQQAPQQHQGNTWGTPAPTGQQAAKHDEPPF